MFKDKKIISIVDKKLDDCRSFQDVLSTLQGINVVKFTDSIEALEHFKLNRENYVLMISDLRMPVINGVQLLKTVKDLNPSARTILMTADKIDRYSYNGYIINPLIDSFLKKPIQLDNLLLEAKEHIKSIKELNKKLKNHPCK